ncbi:MAG: low-complexity tail membrane protein [Vulcanococcus sp.]
MNPARREPLLWLQLLGLAALPLEILLLFLLFAGADPGPFPGFERLLTWAIGALGSAVLFWRLPPDLWSVLILQVPLRGRRPEQFRLSALQTALPLKVVIALGAALLLPLTWWTDSHAGMAWAWSPLSSSPRLVVLLLCIPVLALIQWQWAQVMQSLWMLTRSSSLVDQTLPLTQIQAAEQRLNAGLPLLLLAPLAFAEPAAPVAPEPKATPQDQQEEAEAVTPEPEQTDSPAETEAIPAEAPEPAAEPSQADAEAVVSEDVEVPQEVVEAADVEPETEEVAHDETGPEETTAEAPQDTEEDPAKQGSDDASVVDAGGAVTPEEKPEEG